MWMCVESEILSFVSDYCNSMDYIVHEILQATILEWVAFLFSRASSQPRDQPRSPMLQLSHQGRQLCVYWSLKLWVLCYLPAFICEFTVHEFLFQSWHFSGLAYKSARCQIPYPNAGKEKNHMLLQGKTKSGKLNEQKICCCLRKTGEKVAEMCLSPLVWIHQKLITWVSSQLSIQWSHISSLKLTQLRIFPPHK